MRLIDKVKSKIKKAVINLADKNSAFNNKDLAPDRPLRLHLGCGDDYLKGWLNVDYSKNSKADIVMDFKDLKNLFSENSVQEVLMVHSISYLRFWEAIDFFSDIHRILQKNGKLTLEFPDVIKCAKSLLENDGNVKDYLEAIRGFYAFDIEQIKKREKFITYAFGWSAWHLKHELEKIGFNQVRVCSPETHWQRLWRDTRVEAIK